MKTNQEMKKILRERYYRNNSTIFRHGRDYFHVARLAYNVDIKNKPDELKPYPILTLLGLAIELFFKGLDTEDLTKGFELSDNTPTLIPDTYNVLKTNNTKGHDLYNLFEYFSKKDSDLYQYLSEQYSIQFNQNLQTIFERNRKLFEDSRYVYEKMEHVRYLSDLHTLYELTQFLYQTIEDIFKPVTY